MRLGMYVFSERLCRLMCGEGSASPKMIYQMFRGYAPCCGVAVEDFESNYLGKSETFRTCLSARKSRKEQSTLNRYSYIFIVFVLLFVSPFFNQSALAQNKIPAPEDVIGFKPGDDRKLASWNQILTYFQKLDAASDRMKFEEIGKTTMGKPFVFATISTPENLQKLEYYKKINAQLADPRMIKSNDAVAKRLIKEGKTIVLITCGVHSTEVGSTLSSMLIAHRLASSDEEMVKKILQDTIILLVPSLNPDGVDIVRDWYNKTLGTPYEGTDPPELYHKYVGHDNNRDWYAFTQVETQLTVDKIHNVWHPQIVHDIHQQGAFGSRLFLPPYMQPVEPNVPKQIIEGYTELGVSMMNDLFAQGFTGITNDSTYDAWTPARAYSHYHGGVRILSETASARIATPIDVKFEDLRSREGYDPQKESKNFPKVWRGGHWGLRDITNYMTTAAFSLMKHASENRERWLQRFYEIGKEAVRPRKSGELFAFVLPENDGERESLLKMLERGGVKIDKANAFTVADKKYPREAIVIQMAQPYGSFAKALLEAQKYPDLKTPSGEPIPPYDVTAHTLPLLINVKVEEIYTPFKYQKLYRMSSLFPPMAYTECKFSYAPAIYKSYVPSMDEGWTRWAFEQPTIKFTMSDEDAKQFAPQVLQKMESEKWFQIFFKGRISEQQIQESLKRTGCKVEYESVDDKKIHVGNLAAKFSSIIFPDQSANAILNGHRKGSMPDEYTGGVGEEGVKNLREFVEAGGTLVFLNRASNFAIEQFKLPVKDVTQGLQRKDFYVPGSILRTELDTTHPIAKGMDKASIAWFEGSPAFEITDSSNVRVIARYPSEGDILLSGWALGVEKLKGKAALVEVTIGKGKIILFGFRPQYRGQSLATFPLMFNAITNK